MNIIHNTSVSWPLGVQPSTSLNQKVTPTIKPRPRTTSLLHLNLQEKENKAKCRETLEDLSPGTTSILQRRGMVLVQPNVPVLRNVLEILTCNSTNVKRNRAHSAERVGILHKTASKRGVPLLAAEEELKTPRRYRHPERLEANLPVTPIRLVKTAYSHKIKQNAPENFARLTQKRLEKNWETNIVNDTKEIFSPKSIHDEVRGDTFPDDKVPDGKTYESSAEYQNDATLKQIINVINDSVNDHVALRENVSTISSGSARAPQTPPSTPELHGPAKTPMEKALKHGSAACSYKRSQRNSQVRSFAEARKIVIKADVGSLKTVRYVKDKEYNKDEEYSNEQMSLMSLNILHQLHSSKDPYSYLINKSRNNISKPIISRQLTMPSIKLLQRRSNRNSIGSAREKKYFSVANIRPFTKPEILHAINYVSTYDMDDEIITKVHKINKVLKDHNLIKFQENLPQMNKNNVAYKNGNTPQNNDTEQLILERSDNVENDQRKNISKDEADRQPARIGPIVIPCAANDTYDSSNW